MPLDGIDEQRVFDAKASVAFIYVRTSGTSGNPCAVPWCFRFNQVYLGATFTSNNGRHNDMCHVIARISMVRGKKPLPRASFIHFFWGGMKHQIRGPSAAWMISVCLTQKRLCMHARTKKEKREPLRHSMMPLCFIQVYLGATFTRNKNNAQVALA